jgi:hypothetical protein
MKVFKKTLGDGHIITAYQGLMEFIRELRSHFMGHFPEYEVPGNVYYGYLDMTYFSILPPFLKDRGLKIAIVFVYDTFRFEVWLSGRNRNVQVETSRLLQESGWQSYPLTPDPDKADSILEKVLVENPDFSDIQKLTQKITGGTREFIHDVESFFARLTY